MATLPLDVAIDDTKTTITVVGTIQNCDSPGVITIDSEDIAFTGCSDTQFVNCTRGANATTPAAHARYAEVTYTQNPVVTLPIYQASATPTTSPAGIPSAATNPMMADSVATVGGTATETVAVIGLRATSKVLSVSQMTKGASDLPLLGWANVADDSLDIVYSADMGAGAVVRVVFIP